MGDAEEEYTGCPICGKKDDGTIAETVLLVDGPALEAARKEYPAMHIPYELGRLRLCSGCLRALLNVYDAEDAVGKLIPQRCP